MRLLLTHAYFLRQDPHEQQLMRPFPPLGLQSLVAYLRREGWNDTDWWDATFADGPADFLEVLQRENPTIVGFYGHTITRPVTMELVRACVERGCRVIAGGPDPVQYLDDYFDMGVEVVVVGEGERTVTALLEHLQTFGCWKWEELTEIQGVAFRRDGKVIRTGDRPLIRPLDSLPFPHRERRDLDAYFSAWKARHGKTAMSLSTSRGCPYRCTWCSKQVYGDTFRRRSPGHVVDEVLALRRDWNPDELWFVDDMFTLNRKWVLDFCETMQRRHAVTPFYLIGRAETLDLELLTALKAAGCYRIYLSAESGSQKVLDAMEKGTDLQEIYRAASAMAKVGIELGIFVMLGYPGENRQDVVATLRMIRRLDPAVTLVSVAHPMKGTTFYEQVREQITGKEGGRLLFRMPYSPRFYDAAQRLIWAERAMVQGFRHGEARSLRSALKWPLWRAAVEILP